MDIKLLRQYLANKSPDKATVSESLATHRIVGKVYEVSTYRQPLRGYFARVYLNPVKEAKGLSLTACMVEVELGDKKDAIKKGETWSFDAQENPLQNKPHYPAFTALRASKV